MALPCPRLAAALVLASLAPGCAPEVLLATSWDENGGAAGGNGGGTAGATGTAGEAGGGQAGDGNEPPEPPRIVADSVADFALTQGRHGWLYGYDDGSLANFTLMTTTRMIEDYTPASGDMWSGWASSANHWTQLFELGGHPNGVDTSPPSSKVLQRAVRRWISTVEGELRITGEIAKIDAVADTNGIEASVVIDGVLLYSTFISGDDAAGLSYELTSQVSVGSTLDFVLDPRDSSDHHDLSRFTAIVERVVQTMPE